MTEEPGHATAGRPKRGANPEIVGYRIAGSFAEDPEAIQATLSRKGFFVVATNVLEEDKISASELIDLYKAQGVSVEAGFRFFKLCAVNSYVE